MVYSYRYSLVRTTLDLQAAASIHRGFFLLGILTTGALLSTFTLGPLIFLETATWGWSIDSHSTGLYCIMVQITRQAPLDMSPLWDR